MEVLNIVVLLDCSCKGWVWQLLKKKTTSVTQASRHSALELMYACCCHNTFCSRDPAYMCLWVHLALCIIYVPGGVEYTTATIPTIRNLRL